MKKIAASSLALFTAAAAFGFYGDPPDARHPWGVHDRNRPNPPIITPGTASTPEQPGRAPSDAIVLFDGSGVGEWLSDKDGGPCKWIVKDGALESVKGAGYVKTKRDFADCQLHVEFATPARVEGSDQGRGNSGVFLMGLYEVQVLDCYSNVTYADGQTSAVYAENPPLVNACRAPGEWQSYDIVFHPPQFKEGKRVRDGSVTVFHNGVLTQDHFILEGPTGHKGRPKLSAHAARLPLKLQDHGNPVRYRNIWIRELPAYADVDEAAVAAQRRELAQRFLQEAAGAQGLDKIMKLIESLQYEKSDAALRQVTDLSNALLAPLKGADQKAVEAKKGELESLLNGLKFLTQHGLAPADYAPRQDLEKIARAAGLPFMKK